MLPYTPATCEPPSNTFALVLSSLLCVGLVGSYLPQHLRIINNKSSEGLSPIYLCLGSISSACGVGNLLLLQWPLLRCCSIISFGSCFSGSLGFLQVTLVWLLFSFIFVLYFIYFPTQLKYASPLAHEHPVDTSKGGLKTTRLWKLSIALAVLTVAQFVAMLALSLSLLSQYELPQPTPTKAPHPVIGRAADALGLIATILAISQYLPQILLTWREGFIGALSIGTMMLQTPGSIAFVVSIAIREGTTWSSWVVYACTGFLQGLLLIMCIFWKRRQARLGIDDFGRPITSTVEPVAVDERTPLVAPEASG